MNFYNPYSFYPMTAPARQGLFSSITRGLRGIQWGNVLNNTSRALNIINQAIPAIRQISPMVKNARTMFHVMSELNRSDSPVQQTEASNQMNAQTTSTPSQSEVPEQMGPTFFV